MIIAIDYDGTIGDTSKEKVRWIETNLGKVVSPWACNRTDCVPIIGLEAYEQMGSHVYERESTLQASEVPGALDALRRLSKKGELYVVTARLESRVPFAREWLASKGVLHLFKDILTSAGSSKAAVCSEIGADILIDDDARHLCEVNVDGLMRVLLQDGRQDEPDFGSDINFCSDWECVLTLIDEMP